MIKKNNLLKNNISDIKKHQSYKIRPKSFNDYIGQNSVVNQMKIFIQAANYRKESLDHVLIHGPPGLGKTTLANIISHEMGVNIHSTSGPILEKAGDLAAILTNLENHDILFIDEIHRLSPVVEEILYPAMEDYQIDIMIGEGPSARSVKLNLPNFTLIGATTRASNLTSPLLDRFGIIQRLEFYSINDLQNLVKNNANIFNLILNNDCSLEIAKRSRGTPRIANRILKRVRDIIEVKYKNSINKESVINCLNILNLDTEGFDDMDRKLISTIINKFNGGPVGLNNLSTAISEESTTIEDIIEPFLIKKGFIQRTPRGRIATKQAFQYFKGIYKKIKN